MLKEFRELLKAKRLQKGLSIKAFAEIVGYDAKFISEIELGRKVPSTRCLDKMCLALNVKPFGNFRFFEKKEHREFFEKAAPLLPDINNATLAGIIDLMTAVAKGKIKKVRQPDLDIAP